MSRLALVALLLAACAAPAPCEDPIAMQQAWSDRADSCRGVRLRIPNLSECWQTSYSTDSHCETAREYRCPNGITAIIAVSSADRTGYYVVRDEASQCESRWTMRSEP